MFSRLAIANNLKPVSAVYHSCLRDMNDKLQKLV